MFKVGQRLLIWFTCQVAVEDRIDLHSRLVVTYSVKDDVFSGWKWITGWQARIADNGPARPRLWVVGILQWRVLLAATCRHSALTREGGGKGVHRRIQVVSLGPSP